MASRQKSGDPSPVYKLDCEPYVHIVKKAGNAAHEALRHYGEPTLSLAELRTRLDRELRGISLTELVLKEREAGW